MPKPIVYAVCFCIAVLVALLTPVTAPLFGLASGFAVGFGLYLVDTGLLHRTHFKVAAYGIRTWRSTVRVSISYLYRIHVDGEYLLVKGHRYDQYQPVGGVYKAHQSALARFREMAVLGDNLLPIDEISEDDLRVRVPGKKLLRFVLWFESCRERETDAWREFYEELIASGILPRDPFGLVRYDPLGRHYEPLRFSDYAKSKELLIADIVELLPTPEQLVHLRELKSQSDSRFMWASEDQIRRLGAEPGANQSVRIAETAAWTL